jgi:hypothetical protein
MAKLHIRHGRLACQDLWWPSLPVIQIALLPSILWPQRHGHDASREPSVKSRVKGRGLSCPMHITAITAGYRRNTVVALHCPT